ncbi:DUF1433 domain-containing protein [Staphylococcus caprae]|uniref:DUF1433 domain-containing protein n=1 Tax=Staphylococcus caprae TaxID=29380 RepID=UPI003B21B63C
MKNKKILIPIIILVIVLLITGIGYILHVNKKNHYIETQKSRIYLYFKYNLKKYTSMKITKVEKNPMGDYFIDGYVNGKKDYDFKAFLSIEDNNQYNGMINYNPKTLGKLFKEEEPKNKWKPDEIIKKEHLDNSKYEADPPAFFWF